MLERARGEPTDLLDDTIALAVGVRDLDLERAREETAEIGIERHPS